MRVSRFPLFTVKETPADAEVVSHQLMLRAGLIRKLAAGIYSWLPLGYRVLRRIEAIVHEEQIRAGHIPLLMPTLQPADLWRESGRYDDYGQEMLRIRDRHRVGTNDNWPDTSTYPVLDTNNSYINLHAAAGGADTLWDYGDIQQDTVRIRIGGPILRLYKRTALVNGTSRKPGDHIRYTIYYDNDGSDSTRDTTFIVDYLPTNVALVDTDSVWAGTSGNSGKITTYAMYDGAWVDRIPGLANKTTAIGNDSLLRITALRFAIAPGVDSTGVDNPTMLRADDSTGTDAGWIKFRVRIR